jgi:hypothetical protein
VSGCGVGLGDGLVVRRGTWSRGFARQTVGMFLGEDLLQWLLLALGGALFVGNVTAMVRPPADQQEEGQLERAPIGRSLFYAALGLVAAIWALATLITG